MLKRQNDDHIDVAKKLHLYRHGYDKIDMYHKEYLSFPFKHPKTIID